jgi:hypothetical protein
MPLDDQHSAWVGLLENRRDLESRAVLAVDLARWLPLHSMSGLPLANPALYGVAKLVSFALDLVD